MRRLAVLIAFFVVLSIVPTFARAQEAPPPAPPAAGATQAGADDCVVGRQADGSVLLPTNQFITPAGDQVEFQGRPNAVALRPDGRTAVFLTAFDRPPLTVVDLATNDVLQEFSPDAAPDDDEEVAASYAGVLYAPDGNRLYASDATGAITIADVAADGTLSLVERVVLPGAPEQTPRPGSLALAEDGQTLYVALNMENTVGVFDLATRTLTDQIAVGNAPHSLHRIGGKLYVSNEGGRPAQQGDFTNDSAGTELVADPRLGLASTGTVSVIDLASGVEERAITVGLRPTALLQHDDYLFVANTNSDTVSVIDIRSDEVVKAIAVEAFPGAPWGSSPSALAMVAGENGADARLVVSLAGNNALGVYDWAGPDQAVAFVGLVPTGWHPSDLALDAAAGRLIVANAKGVGSLGPEAEGPGIVPGTPGPVGRYVHSNQGSTSLIPFTALDDLAESTAAVYRNNQWSGARCADLERGGAAGEDPTTVAPRPVPLRIGDPSTIKHVFYIIKENRTYDQVLGDMPEGNGDPSLTQFGREVTPNQHALAEQFQLMDNLYVSGSLSADGHQWVTQAYTSDYIEQAFADFVRSYPYDGGDALAYSPTGFLWDNAVRNGRTVRAYGEYANELRGPEDRVGTWSDWYRDWLIMSGQESGERHVPDGTFTTHSDVPSLDALLDRGFPPYAGQVFPDQYRAEIFLEEFAEFEANGNLPNLITMQLVQNHTSGLDPDFPTPRAMVADNDLALGRIVEAITESRYWPESAIFVIEDDAQNGVDHVDGHRTTGWVISPYAKRGIVSSAYYTQIDMVRTIAQILGLPPMNQMDLAATPMRDLFTDVPDLTTFTALPNEVPLDEMNLAEAAATGALPAAWIETSEAMGFGDVALAPDSADENLLNRAIWYGSRGFDEPYPGDTRVLWPHEVAPAVADEWDAYEEAAGAGEFEPAVGAEAGAEAPGEAPASAEPIVEAEGEA